MSADRSTPSPPAIGLASWLGGGSAIVVTIAVTTMAFACALLLDRIVEQQALARVQLAASSTRELLRRVGEDVLSSAQVLAERPTLQRLLGTLPIEGVPPLLARFCESSGNTACAVQGPEGQLLSSGVVAPWTEAITARREQGERFMVATRDGASPWWGSIVVMTEPAGWQVLVLRQATPALMADLARQVDAQLNLLNYAAYQAPPGDPLTSLHSAVLASGRVSGQRLEASDEYAASIAITAPTGEVIALLDARMPGKAFAAMTAGFNRLLLLIAVLVALIAGVGGLLYGRWLARPVVALRDVVERIGHGDLTASMPPVAPLEVGALARSMDAMRRNLATLTDSLRRREAEAQALLGAIVEGVYAVDGERVIRYANPQVGKLLHLPESEIVGRFCGDVLRPAVHDGRRPCERNCPIVAARSAAQASAPESLCMADGSRRSTIIVSAAPVGGIQVQVLRDETELEAVRRARDSVLGNISHEFRTPLAAQLASIELLRDGLATLDRDAQHELLANVERGVLRLMRLIDNLLESVRIEAGQLAIRAQQVDMPEVVREASELLQPLLDQRRLRLDVQLDTIDATVPGDSQRLLQVFVNLLSNAVKFAPEGSTIRIGGRRLETELELWVDDAGPGLAEGSGAAIFERFQRAAGAEPDAPGLGLGLWIVRSIIERHGGRVEATRTADQHTRFLLSLPLQERA